MRQVEYCDGPVQLAVSKHVPERNGHVGQSPGT